jgi:hypothetical protein
MFCEKAARHRQLCVACEPSRERKDKIAAKDSVAPFLDSVHLVRQHRGISEALVGTGRQHYLAMRQGLPLVSSAPQFALPLVPDLRASVVGHGPNQIVAAAALDVRGDRPTDCHRPTKRSMRFFPVI